MTIKELAERNLREYKLATQIVGPAPLAAPSAPSKHQTLVAEGDSWFDYPPGRDVLDWLEKAHGYTIHKVAKFGSLLEYMVLGVGNDDDQFGDIFGRDASQLIETMKLVEQHQPTVLLFSGGGNDIVGEPLTAYLNYKSEVSGLPALRAPVIDHVVNTVLRRCYEVLLETLQMHAQQGGFEVPVVVAHGYDYPVPDGRGVLNVPLVGPLVSGPWIRPYLDEKGHTEAPARYEIMKAFMSAFNLMLAKLEADFPSRFKYANVTNTLGGNNPALWANELHPTNEGFRLVAEKIHATIQSIP